MTPYANNKEHPFEIDVHRRFRKTVECDCYFRHMSVCLSVSQSVCLSVSQSVSQSVCQSVCLSVCLSVSQSVCLSVSLSVCHSVCQSVCLSVCHSVCQSVCLSVRHHVTTRLPLDGFSCNLDYFLKICPETCSLIKTANNNRCFS